MTLDRQILPIVFALAAALPVAARAQDGYEIQVYPSETMARGVTMFELHSNYTFTGSTAPVDGVVPTNHALHETVEITHGFNDWFELGFYTFTTVQPDGGWSYVGNHIRPRVRAPESWGWPVGASLSVEVGAQQRDFATETWSAEIRPIVDKQMGRFYWSINPTVGVPLKHDSTTPDGAVFAPNIAATFDVSRAVNLGLEYYGDFGPFGSFEPLNQAAQQLYVVSNLNVSPKWEINFGTGFGLTPAADQFNVKLILGYRLH